MTYRVIAEWQDCNLRHGYNSWYQVDDSNASDLLSCIQTYSNAGLQQHVEGDLIVTMEVPDTTMYTSLHDWVVLTFCTAAGNLVKLKLMAPSMDIFHAPPNNDMVDPSAIADLITAAIGTLSDVAGNPVTSYAGGIRMATRMSDL
jgi:hypothetical protein